MTVLDNASHDETPDVCDRWALRFPEFHAIRHRRNIGLGANYLRAVENSESAYTWVLSDDEHLNFSDCQDVVDGILEGWPDLISLGSPGQEAWERGLRTTAASLLERGSRFFYAFTFVAGVIFRTEDFDDHCVHEGYRQVANVYPQWEHVYQSVLQDRRVLTSQATITERRIPPAHEALGSHLWWYAAWTRAAARIREPALRERVIREPLPPRAWLWLAVHVVRERIEHPDRVRRLTEDLRRGAPMRRRVQLWALAPATYAPGAFLRVLTKWVRRAQGFAGSENHPERFDPLRL